MNGNAVRHTLIRGDVIAPEPLAPGFPLWMPHGTLLMERVERVVRQAVQKLGDVQEIVVPLLFEAHPYGRRVSESLEYRNMFALPAEDLLAGAGGPQAGDDGEGTAPAAPHGDLLLRPDNVLSAAGVLAGRPRGGTVLCCGSLWRADTERAVPLVRDRHMWRAVEALTLVPEGEDHRRRVDEVLDTHWQVLADLCHVLALPQIYYAGAGLRDHSAQCLLSLATPSPDVLTLTSTLFELSPRMSQRLGVAGTLVDLGVTAKLLALALVTLADEHGLVMSSALAPDQVVVGARRAGDAAEARRLADVLRASGLRAGSRTGTWAPTLREMRRRGVPVLVLVDARGGNKVITRADHRSQQVGDDLTAQVRALLEEQDRLVRSRSRAVLDEALRREEAVRLVEPGEPVPDGWYALGEVRSIGEVPGDVRSEVGAARVLSRSRRLY